MQWKRRSSCLSSAVCACDIIMQLVVALVGVLFLISCGAMGQGAGDDAYVKDVIKDALYFINACGQKDLLVCLKEKVLKYIDQLPDSFEITGVVKIKRNEHQRNSTMQRQLLDELPEEPRARENALDRILMNRVMDFIGSHSVEFKVPREAVGEMKRSMEEEARKKKGKKGGMSGLFLMFYLKMATLAAIAMKVLTLIAFKALLLGKIALTISGVLALKKLFEQKHSATTYEVIAHPQYEEYTHHDRTFVAPDVVYKRPGINK